MPVEQVTRPGGSFDALIPNLDLTRPLEGLTYPLLKVAVLAAFTMIAIGLGTGVIKPMVTNLFSQLPVVGGAMAQAGGQANFDFGVPS